MHRVSIHFLVHTVPQREDFSSKCGVLSQQLCFVVVAVGGGKMLAMGDKRGSQSCVHPFGGCEAVVEPGQPVEVKSVFVVGPGWF